MNKRFTLNREEVELVELMCDEMKEVWASCMKNTIDDEDIPTLATWYKMAEGLMERIKDWKNK